MVSGFFTSPCDHPRIFSGDASLIRIASNVMGFACRSRMPHRSLVGLSSLIRLPKGLSVSIRTLLWEDLLPLDDRLVDAVASLHVIGLHREHLLERVGGAVGFQRPYLHLAEPLAAEL